MSLNAISVVVSGQWNTNIFTPNWVFKNVFNLNDLDEAELGIDPNEFKLVFKLKNITLIPHSHFVEFKISDYKEETLLLAANSCIKLITLLPHTTKLAVGINYKYEKKESLKKKFLNIVDGFEISQVTYKKKLECCDLNLIKDNRYTLFNYHHTKPELFKSEYIVKYFKETEELWKAL